MNLLVLKWHKIRNLLLQNSTKFMSFFYYSVPCFLLSLFYLLSFMRILPKRNLVTFRITVFQFLDTDTNSVKRRNIQLLWLRGINSWMSYGLNRICKLYIIGLRGVGIGVENVYSFDLKYFQFDKRVLHY